MSTHPPSNEIPGNDRSTDADQKPATLETDVSLSKSLIWRWQREFYVGRGLSAWTEEMVPSYITNNPFIAEIYARIVFGFLCDCVESGEKEAQPIAEQNPLRIVELGAGTGKFSYLFLRHIAALLREKSLPLKLLRYCMADCAASLLQAWQKNSYLAEFVACGMLEFDLFEAGETVQSPFICGKESNSVQGPLVLIANYVFDSLPQDAFVINDGQIFEALLSTKSTPSGGKGKSQSFADLQFSYKNVEINSNHYSDPRWNGILEYYRSHLPAATVLFPCAALKILQDAVCFTNGRMLVLAADKGYPYEDELLLSQGAPPIEFHASSHCFSQTVNFHAIGKYFESIGGALLAPDKHSTSLNICAFLQHQSGDQFPAAKSAYRETQAVIGTDDVFALLAWLNAHMEEITMPQILAVLRLTHWDPLALERLFPVLARQLRTVVAERNDLRNAILRTWANHYPLNPSENILAFHCGAILLELRFFAEAQEMFKISQQQFAPSAATSYNLGLCCQGLGQSSEALAYMVEACNLDPNFEPAKLAHLKLENEANSGIPKKF